MPRSLLTELADRRLRATVSFPCNASEHNTNLIDFSEDAAPINLRSTPTVETDNSNNDPSKAEDPGPTHSTNRLTDVSVVIKRAFSEIRLNSPVRAFFTEVFRFSLKKPVSLVFKNAAVEFDTIWC